MDHSFLDIENAMEQAIIAAEAMNDATKTFGAGSKEEWLASLQFEQWVEEYQEFSQCRQQALYDELCDHIPGGFDVEAC